jgi:hypothetical protein
MREACPRKTIKVKFGRCVNNVTNFNGFTDSGVYQVKRLRLWGGPKLLLTRKTTEKHSVETAFLNPLRVLFFSIRKLVDTAKPEKLTSARCEIQHLKL